MTSGKYSLTQEFILSLSTGGGSRCSLESFPAQDKCYNQLSPGIRPAFSHSLDNPFCQCKGEAKAFGVHSEASQGAGVTSLQAVSGFEYPARENWGHWEDGLDTAGSPQAARAGASQLLRHRHTGAVLPSPSLCKDSDPRQHLSLHLQKVIIIVIMSH